MYNLQRIADSIAKIEGYIHELDACNIKTIVDLNNSKNYHASSMLLFAILNKLTDLGGEIISFENLGAPNRYLDIMPLLAKGGIINHKQADDLNKLIENRNTLAHFYEDITKGKLLNLIKDVFIIKEFLKCVKNRVKKNKIT